MERLRNTVILTKDCQPGHGFKASHECILRRSICSHNSCYRKAPVIAFPGNALFLRSAQWIPEVLCIPSPRQALGRVSWICDLHTASDNPFHATCECREVVFIVIHVLKVGKHSRVVTSSMKFFQTKTHMAKIFFFLPLYLTPWIMCCTVPGYAVVACYQRSARKGWRMNVT